MINRQNGSISLASIVFLASVALTGCDTSDSERTTQRTDTSQTDEVDPWSRMEVRASSYTLDPRETRAAGDQIGAFGHKLSPDQKIIAVSRDLFRAGLIDGTEVRIEGLDGVYTVRDKMHRRWREKIDILFAKRARALKWGIQTVTIHYRPPLAH
ncbi:3D domain-containing protein [Salinisphaera sp. Q1T1-3]|uniref:3D domain-containing protein n=1 Tax=Salinisphaera sp. Q1T1-3 TaxID=2321229 RepID=UPI000E74DE6E|nr:3D domain-containing protein [Salinisphaera sp. Q1T1-3]RJS93246.1 hypothetical protein D3260_08150 [Salinisphaera sp. Q1T1-3]